MLSLAVTAAGAGLEEEGSLDGRHEVISGGEGSAAGSRQVEEKQDEIDKDDKNC